MTCAWDPHQNIKNWWEMGISDFGKLCPKKKNLLAWLEYWFMIYAKMIHKTLVVVFFKVISKSNIHVDCEKQ